MSEQLLRERTIGMDPLEGFIKEHYLEEYIPAGGSKIKFLTGRRGSGKTHFSHLLLEDARDMGYLTVSFSAREIWLHDFREIYLEILRQCDIEEILRKAAGSIVKDLGYDPDEIPEGKSFLDYLSEKGEADPLSKSEIRAALRKHFSKNTILDNNFAACCSLLTGGILGHPVLESSNKELLLAFMKGDKSVKLSQLRALGLSPSKVTKYNARNLLRSLSEVIRFAGYKGLFISIDDMEVLLNRSANEGIRYTRVRRDDAYESIRQLIDDIDKMHYILFLLAFDRELMDNDSYGMKSYQALWMRIQNEVVSARFNKFADIIDLDRYADEYYDAAILSEMSEKFAQALRSEGRVGKPIDENKAYELQERARYGGIGLPYLVKCTVAEGGKDHD